MSHFLATHLYFFNKLAHATRKAPYIQPYFKSYSGLYSRSLISIIPFYLRKSLLKMKRFAHSLPQGLVAIFLLVKIFHVIYDNTIKGAIDEKIKF